MLRASDVVVFLRPILETKVGKHRCQDQFPSPPSTSSGVQEVEVRNKWGGEEAFSGLQDEISGGKWQNALELIECGDSGCFQSCLLYYDLIFAKMMYAVCQQYLDVMPVWKKNKKSACIRSVSLAYCYPQCMALLCNLIM